MSSEMDPLILLVLCSAFVLRVLPRLILKNAICSDAYFHLSMARAIRDNGHRIPDTIPRVILPHRYAYPYLYHWLVSFLSEKNRLRFERISGAAIDTLYVFVSYLFVNWMLSEAGFSEYGETMALWTAFLVAIAPGLLRVGTGPRAYHGSPRPLGQLLFLIYMCSFVLFSLSHNGRWLLLSFLAAVLIVITSKFTNQVAVFFGLLLCLMGNFVPLVTFVTGFLFAGIITNGRAFRVVRTQVEYSIFYFKHLQKRYLYPGVRNMVAYLGSLGSCLKSMVYFTKTVFRDRSGIDHLIRGLVWLFTETYWPHLILSSFPQVVIIIIFSISWHECTNIAPGVSSLGALFGPWIVVSFAWMIITSLKPFLFLGEAVRYVENTVMPQILLLTIFAFALNKPWTLRVIFIYSLISYVMYVKIYYDSHKMEKNIFDNFLPMLSKIDQPGTRIFGIGTIFWALLYGTHRADILCPMSGMDIRDRKVVSGNYPLPGVKIRELVDKYQIEFLVGSELSIEHYEKVLDDTVFSQGEFVLVDSRDVFRIYSCAKAVYS